MLGSHSHGKGGVCVLRLFRSAERHEVRQFEVETELVGPVEASYTGADNSLVVATDTQKNTVFLLAKELDPSRSSREDFAVLLARHFVKTYPTAVHACTVRVKETIWERMTIAGKPHQHAFTRKGQFVGHAAAKVEGPKGRIAHLESGVRGLTVLKTTQ